MGSCLPAYSVPFEAEGLEEVEEAMMPEELDGGWPNALGLRHDEVVDVAQGLLPSLELLRVELAPFEVGEVEFCRCSGL